MIKEFTIKGGTQRSWDREVGYGKMPGWYSKPYNITMTFSDLPDINKILREYDEKCLMTSSERKK